jgi:hypothetical protein
MQNAKDTCKELCNDGCKIDNKFFLDDIFYKGTKSTEAK